MLVYRLEREDGRGPYKGGACPRAQSLHNLPAPQSDPGLQHIATPDTDIWQRDLPEQWRHGFVSKAQLICWFAAFDVEEYWLDHSCGVYVYEVHEDDVVSGVSQCLYNRHRAVRVSRIETTQALLAGISITQVITQLGALEAAKLRSAAWHEASTKAAIKWLLSYTKEI